jgi:hypothetical protein
LAEPVLDNHALKVLLGKKLLTPAARRKAVRCLIEELDYRERRACGFAGIHRATYQYRSRRKDESAFRRQPQAFLPALLGRGIGCMQMEAD